MAAVALGVALAALPLRPVLVLGQGRGGAGIIQAQIGRVAGTEVGAEVSESVIVPSPADGAAPARHRMQGTVLRTGFPTALAHACTSARRG